MVKSNVIEFGHDLLAFASETVPREYIDTQVKVGLELVTRIVDKTPKVSGYTKANWQVGIGKAPTGLIGSPGSQLLGHPTIENGFRVLAGYRLSGKVDTIYIVNNALHVSQLEHGSSQQAPAGMVAVSIQEVETIF